MTQNWHTGRILPRVSGWLVSCSHAPLSWRLAASRLMVVGAALTRLGLLPVLGSSRSYITFYPAVAFAAFIGGLPAGLFAAVLSAFVAHVWIAPLEQTADWIELVSFALSSLIIASMAESLHRAGRASRRRTRNSGLRQRCMIVRSVCAC